MTTGDVARFAPPADLAAMAAPAFDLALTLSCGQVFHWRPSGTGWIGLAGATPMIAEQRGDELRVTRGTEERAREYFSLDHPLEEIYGTFPRDDPMRDALATCRGLRIIRQPLWECVATFITSAMKQVSHIAQISDDLRQRFGAPVAFGNRTLFSYPPPERIAALDESQLRECRLGFRAKNLLGAARMIATGEFDLERLRTLNDEETRRELCRLPGVGEKVANCAMLFGYSRLEAFPIDVWIERVLRETYFKRKRKITVKMLREFSASHFGAYGGYAQQYLFHHARTTRPRGAKRGRKSS